MKMVYYSNIFFSDTEVTGPSLRKNALINLAATTIDLSTYEEVDSIDLVVNMIEGTVWDEDTVQNFWQKHPQLAAMRDVVIAGEGLEPQKAMDMFVTFLRKYKDPTCNNIAICCDHSEIDSSWVNLYLAEYGHPPLHMIYDDFVPVM
jgi:hypothetical protein